MRNDDEKLERLLRNASAPNEESEIPFGFDTRVVALWRSGAAAKPNGLSRLLRQVMIVSAAVLVISCTAAGWEINRGLKTKDLASNEFAIVDSAIQNEFYR